MSGLHRESPTWATAETLRTIVLFLGMALGSFGAGNFTTGHMGAAILELQGDIHAVSANLEGIREDLARQEAAVSALKHGTVNPSNISRVVAVASAIGELDRDDSSVWTAGGKPRISALEGILKTDGRRDFKITSIERDHACAISNLCR